MIKAKYFFLVPLFVLVYFIVSIRVNSMIATIQTVGHGSYPQVSPNGQFLLTARGHIILLGDSSVLDLSHHLNNFLSPQWLSNTQVIYAHRLDNQSGFGLYQYYVLDTTTRQSSVLTPVFEKQYSSDNFSVSPNKANIAFWSLNKNTRQLSIFDIVQKRLINYDQPINHICHYVNWLSESTLLLACTDENTHVKNLWFLDRNDDSLTLSLENHSYENVFSMSPNNEWLAIVEPQTGIVLIDLQNGKPIWDKKWIVMVKGQSFWRSQSISFQNKGLATNISWLSNSSGFIYDEGIESTVHLIKFNQ